MKNYQDFLSLISAPENRKTLLGSGAFREATIDAYTSGIRRARAVTVLLAAAILGVSWTQYSG